MVRVAVLCGVVLLGAACVFEGRGTPSGSEPPDQRAPIRLTPLADVNTAGAEAAPRIDTRKPQLAPDRGADLAPSPDGTPPCTALTCAGCCAGNACKVPTTNSLCGSAGQPCQDCASTGKVCSAAGSCTNCSASEECSGETLCLSGVCKSAYGRKYTITMYSAKVLATKPNGPRWDSQSNPDPRAVLTIAGQGSWETITAWDKLDPVWDQFVDHRTLQADTQVDVSVYDVELSGPPELMGKVTLSPGVPLAALRSGIYQYKASDAKASLQELILKFKAE